MKRLICQEPRAIEIERACYNAAVRVARMFPASFADVYQESVLLALKEKERFDAIPLEYVGAYVYCACRYNAIHKITRNKRAVYVGVFYSLAAPRLDRRDWERLERQKKAVLYYAHCERHGRHKQNNKTTRFVEMTLDGLRPCEIAKALGVENKDVVSSLYQFALHARRYFEDNGGENGTA